MSFGKKSYIDTPEPEPAGLQDEQLSSAQEATPVPWFCGKRKIAVRWICRAYDLHGHAAPSARPGKK